MCTPTHPHTHTPSMLSSDDGMDGGGGGGGGRGGTRNGKRRREPYRSNKKSKNKKRAQVQAEKIQKNPSNCWTVGGHCVALSCVVVLQVSNYMIDVI